MTRKMCKKVNHSVVIEKENFNGKHLPCCDGVINCMYEDFDEECKKCSLFFNNVEEQESKE